MVVVEDLENVDPPRQNGGSCKTDLLFLEELLPPLVPLREKVKS